MYNKVPTLLILALAGTLFSATAQVNSAMGTLPSAITQDAVEFEGEPGYASAFSAPEFIYGEEEMIALFTETLPDIERPKLNRDQDSVTVRFKVLETGAIAEITFESKVKETCAAEMIRVVRITEGLWTPPSDGGKETVRLQVPMRVCSLAEQRKKKAAADRDVTLTEGASSAHYNDLGLKKATEGKDQLAVKLFDEALRLNPKYASAYLNRGISRFNVGDVHGACVDWSRATGLGDRYAQLYELDYCR